MRQIKSLPYCIILLLFIFSSCQENRKTRADCPVIPKPLSCKLQSGTFTFGNSTVIELKTGDDGIKKAAEFLKCFVEQTGDCSIKIDSDDDTRNKIVFAVCDTISRDDAYTLKITPREITITSKSGEGAFYAVQTLRQLLPVACEKKICDENVVLDVPCVSIYDVPRFSHRGFMLDVARHYFPVDFIKKSIDMMALYKLNVLHLHLTDDQGWRVEIKSKPRLTSVGAWRRQSIVGHKNDEPRKYDGKRHGGYYTQEELREIVEYAQDRFIEVIPEIEMPGHTQSILAAYPQMACFPKDYEVSCDWGVHKNVLCTREESFKFLEDVLSEVFEIFPSKYIHIGGDECPKEQWSKCPVCQQNIKKMGLKDEYELQSYFINRMEKFVNSHGRQIIGWDEILEGGIAPNAIVMSWRGEEGGIKAAEMKHSVIMTPRDFCYLDYYQSEDRENEPLAIYGYLPLDSVYSYNPTEELTPEQSQYIRGIQGNLWTEYIATPEHAEYMAYPRLIALAEVGWSSQKERDYSDFIRRLSIQSKRLDFLQVNYAKHFLFSKK